MKATETILRAAYDYQRENYDSPEVVRLGLLLGARFDEEVQPMLAYRWPIPKPGARTRQFNGIVVLIDLSLPPEACIVSIPGGPRTCWKDWPRFWADDNPGSARSADT